MRKTKMNKIRILVIEPNKEPYQLKVEHTLENLQKIVGGLIEFVELEHNVDLICNEEGKINKLPMNRIITNDVVCGTFFIAGHHKGKTISLSRKQIEKYKKEFRVDKDKWLIQFLTQNILDSSCLLNVSLYGVEKALYERKQNYESR